ncbi:hypothetical protein [Rhizobium leguminosarum]|uniref:hypothetical protein n=1 Tax=Rhizobium leguminosarum TaxID=384 RepID=UPI000B92CEFF|nr:hypothetical protein [Rhizobium leguminosarum]ASS55891.1 hypothetical protein CHR56_15690 [Rhizobium leguminosarum bv. viciae]
MAIYSEREAAAIAEKNYLSGGALGQGYIGKATEGPVERSAIAEVHVAFKQADELCRYAEMVVAKLMGGGAQEGSTDDPKTPYGAFPILMAEAVSIQRRMNEAMSALRRLESQLP